MALPTEHDLRVIHPSAHTPSIGTTPIAAVIRIPFRCQIMKACVVTAGTITSTDCVISVALSGTGTSIVGTSLTVPVSAADKGQVVTAVPTSNTYGQLDDMVVFTPASASGTSIPATVSLTLKAI